jgi:hypothetical protein
MNGSVCWAPGSGSVIGAGFGRPTVLVAGGLDEPVNLEVVAFLDQSEPRSAR